MNLLGEHTDYNGGYVLPIAIPQQTRVALAWRANTRVVVWSEAKSDLASCQLSTEGHTGNWRDYVQGVTAALARLAQWGENEIVSAPVGILDPMACHLADEHTARFLGVRELRDTVHAVAALREVNPAIRIVQVDPVIHVVPRSAGATDGANAEAYRQSQFTAWDILLGRIEPDLGGHNELIDVIGVNYYIHTQFMWQGSMIVPSEPRYRHFSGMLQEVYERYRRPLFVAETGIEDDTRPAWLRYMSQEVFTAMAAGVPVEGICLYPIVNHPGWTTTAIATTACSTTRTPRGSGRCSSPWRTKSPASRPMSRP